MRGSSKMVLGSYSCFLTIHLRINKCKKAAPKKQKKLTIYSSHVPQCELAVSILFVVRIADISLPEFLTLITLLSSVMEKLKTRRPKLIYILVQSVSLTNP